MLAHGYSGDNILVNDPGYSTSSYTLSQIVNGNNGIYTVANGNYEMLMDHLRKKSEYQKNKKSL